MPWCVWIVLELLPQMRHVDAQILLHVAVRVVPDLAEELAVRDRPPGMAQQREQESPLGGREMYRLPVAQDRAAADVHRERAESKRRFREWMEWHPGAPELRTHARAELHHPERLGGVVVRARVEQRRLLLLGVSRREHDDRRGRPSAA